MGDERDEQETGIHTTFDFSMVAHTHTCTQYLRDKGSEFIAVPLVKDHLTRDHVYF